MIRNHRIITACTLAAALSLSFVQPASARMSTWRSTEGERFRGEPAAIMGPLAIFKTGRVASKRLMLSLLSPKDCVRFHQELQSMPKRADDWANASSAITREMLGAVRKLENGRLVAVDLRGRPEPDYIILFRAIHDRRRTWDIMRHAIDEYHVIKEAFPDKIEAFFRGYKMSDLNYLEVATEIDLPWLLPDLADRHRMDDIEELLPRNSPALMVVTRSGVPIVGTNSDSEADVSGTMASLIQLLALDRPGAAGAAKDQEYYYRNVQPAIHADSAADPILIADPLSPGGLRQAGVTALSASIQVATDGSVTSVEMSPDNELSEGLTQSLSNSLARARFVPAVENGSWVAGTYEYRLVAP